MKLHPGFAAEYRRRHAAVWPGLSALLHNTGIREYSIFLDEASLTLETNPDHSPVTKQLKEVFYVP